MAIFNQIFSNLQVDFVEIPLNRHSYAIFIEYTLVNFLKLSAFRRLL